MKNVLKLALTVVECDGKHHAIRHHSSYDPLISEEDGERVVFTLAALTSDGAYSRLNRDAIREARQRGIDFVSCLDF